LPGTRTRRDLANRPWLITALISRGIALFDYLLQVPANRIGHGVMSVVELEVLQEIISPTGSVPFAVFYLRERPNRD
jgi:uncharacterized protein (DUF486 family)